MKPQPLFQVCVEDRKGNLLRVGPQWTRDAAEQLCVAIGKQIIEGKEKVWSNPHVVPVTTLH